MITEEYKISDILYIIIISILFLIIDGIWLYIMKDTFSKIINDVQKSSIRIKIVPGILIYIIMTLGLYHFIIKERKSPIQAVILGYFVYAIFEGTNYAIFKEWDLKTAILDTLWGGSLFGFTTFFFYLIYNRINKGKDEINV
jgi:uncharacterized membrane protein